MFLEHLKVNNFRQLENVEVCFDRNLTFIAGGNNSGKTSLLDIMNFAFSDYKDLSYDDMSLDKLEELLKTIVEKVKDLEELDATNPLHKIHLFRDYLVGLSSESNANIQMFYTLDIEDGDDLRYVGDFIIAVEDELKLHFLVQYGLSEKKINNREDVIERLYDHVRSFSIKGEGKKTQSDYAHAIYLLNQLSSKKLYYCSCRIDEKGYHYSTDKEKLYDVNITNYRHFIQTQFIPAQKNLGEYEASEKSLKHLIIQNVSENMADWDEKISEITEKFRSNIDKAISSKELNEQIQYLNNQMMKYQKLNGNQRQDLELVFTHTYQEVERYLRNVWNLHTKDLVNDDAYRLPNSKQGLGFNHLLYIYFYIEMMKTQSQDDHASFNLLVIEEPENHMHPHMQQMLVRYLYEVKEKLNFQIILTTHSSDMVKNLAINDIRVLRKEKNKTKEYDLSTFMQGIEEDKKKFYEKFFGVTMYPLVFSDAAILYEGDTERLFIETLLSNRTLLEEVYDSNKEVVEKLRNRYISLIQVGGAYAHRYFDFVDFLKIRTVIFTDIDYHKKFNSLDDIKEDREEDQEWKKISSNSVLRTILDLKDYESVQQLFNLMKDGSCVEKVNGEFRRSDKEGSIKIFTQTEDDGYARTLEDAMLFSYLQNHEGIGFSVENVFCKLSKDQWGILSEINQIKIPNIGSQDDKQSIRKRVQTGLSESSKKTDFMYSFLLHEDDALASAVPRYVYKGLRWLVSEE